MELLLWTAAVGALCLLSTVIEGGSSAWRGRPEEAGSRTQDSSTKERSADRDPRGLVMKKIGFLAGLKAGSAGLISNSGSLAASNSLRVFGKVMNTALSVSYGHPDDLDPLPQLPSPQRESSGGPLKEASTVSVLQDRQRLEEAALAKDRKNFIKQHNTMVSRINTKFFRSDRSSGG